MYLRQERANQLLALISTRRAELNCSDSAATELRKIKHDIPVGSKVSVADRHNAGQSKLRTLQMIETHKLRSRELTLFLIAHKSELEKIFREDVAQTCAKHLYSDLNCDSIAINLFYSNDTLFNNDQYAVVPCFSRGHGCHKYVAVDKLKGSIESKHVTSKSECKRIIKILKTGLGECKKPNPYIWKKEK